MIVSQRVSHPHHHTYTPASEGKFGCLTVQPRFIELAYKHVRNSFQYMHQNMFSMSCDRTLRVKDEWDLGIGGWRQGMMTVVDWYFINTIQLYDKSRQLV